MTPRAKEWGHCYRLLMKTKFVVILLLLLFPCMTPAYSAESEPSSPTSESTTSPKKPSTTSNAPTAQSELARVSALLAAKNFTTARLELQKIDKSFPNNADVNNLLGFSSRKLKLYASSATYYKKALKINPSHRGALEYQGELFVVTKKIAAAKANLQKLEVICGLDCAEYKDLKAAIGDKK